MIRKPWIIIKEQTHQDRQIATVFGGGCQMGAQTVVDGISLVPWQWPWAPGCLEKCKMMICWENVENHRKTMGKLWENHRKTMGNCGVMGFYGIYPLVICYIAVENYHRNSGFSH